MEIRTPTSSMLQRRLVASSIGLTKFLSKAEDLVACLERSCDRVERRK